MNVVAWILGIILAGVFGFGGVTKVLDLDRAREHFGYSKRQYQLVGLSEIAGAAGIVVGLIWRKVEWIGLAAATGIATLMVSALIVHARVEDEGKQVIPALVMLVLASVFAVVLALR